MKDPRVNGFLRTVSKAKWILNSHLVEEPTDSTARGSENMELTWGHLGHHLTVQKIRLSTKTKKYFCVCEASLCPHGSSVLAETAELGSAQCCPHLFQTVLFHPSVQQAIQPSLVWHDSLHSQFGLTCKIFVIFTKLPLTDRKLFFFWLLASAFTFFLQQK